MTLRVLPKPEGYDLRVKRAEKKDSSHWLPDDALYSASAHMKDHPPAGACIVAWFERDAKTDSLRLQYRCYQEHDRQATALAADLVAYLSHP